MAFFSKTGKEWGAALLSICLLSSCAAFKSNQATRFSPDKIELGMSKNKFIREFGNPTMQNSYVENGVTVDELVYMETIVFNYEQRKVNSTFVFNNGELVRREQAEDLQYLQQQQFEKFLEMQKKENSKTE